MKADIRADDYSPTCYPLLFLPGRCLLGLLINPPTVFISRHLYLTVLSLVSQSVVIVGETFLLRLGCSFRVEGTRKGE